MDVHIDVHMEGHNLGLENYFFSKVLGIVFFDPKSLSIDLLVMVPDFFKVTFDRFFSGPPKLSKMVQNGSGVSFDRFLGRPEADLKGGSGGREPPQLRANPPRPNHPLTVGRALYMGGSPLQPFAHRVLSLIHI